MKGSDIIKPNPVKEDIVEEPKDTLFDDDFEDVKPKEPTNKSSNSKSKTPVLDNFGRDLTRAAEEKRLDPIVGREKELERVAQILSRRKKNNPVLIGEPGVGKSSQVLLLREMLWVCGSLVSTGGILREGFPT